MLLNNLDIGERHNRPTVLQPVGLQCFFIQDGQYVDPYAISAVTILPRIRNLAPSTVLNAQTQLLESSAVSGSIVMNFTNYPRVLTTASSFNASNYSAGASGIFKISTGRYVAVLNGSVEQSGVYNLDGFNTPLYNTASSTGDYIDVWTVQMYQGSKLQTIINEFTLRKGGFTVLTQPLMLKTKTRLVNSKVTLGSKVNLKIATDVHVENSDIDESIKNLLRDNVVTSGSIEIQKMNDAANLPARVTVSSYSDTSSLTDITSDNVFMFSWDTTTLSTHPQLVAGNFGSIQGIYSIKVKYKVLNEEIVSDPMYLTLS